MEQFKVFGKWYDEEFKKWISPDPTFNKFCKGEEMIKSEQRGLEELEQKVLHNINKR